MFSGCRGSSVYFFVSLWLLYISVVCLFLSLSSYFVVICCSFMNLFDLFLVFSVALCRLNLCSWFVASHLILISGFMKYDL